ncbi:MAG: GNAT family N-acetyltransferase, partial [Kineosporiaceae bacterium]
MTRPPVDVRPAGLADVDDLVQLWTSAREELARNGRPLGAADAEGLRRRLATALAEDGLQVVLARWAGRPAGYALMRVAALAPLLDGVVLHVDHLFVLPELRRHGIARALHAMVAGTAERLGADQVVA